MEVVDWDNEDVGKITTVRTDVTLPVHDGVIGPEMGEPIPEDQAPDAGTHDDANGPEIDEEGPATMEIPTTDVGNNDGITRILDERGNLPPGIEDKDKPDLKSPPYQYYN